MARFFFDSDVGEFLVDDHGDELPDLEAARQTGFETLNEFAKGRSEQFWRNGGKWEVHCRDEHGRRLFTLTLLAQQPAV